MLVLQQCVYFTHGLYLMCLYVNLGKVPEKFSRETLANFVHKVLGMYTYMNMVLWKYITILHVQIVYY